MRVPLHAEESATTEPAPQGVDSTASRSFGSSGETQPTPSVPPWLTPANFDFLRRVAQVVSESGGK
jgi:hypothetical protein